MRTGFSAARREQRCFCNRILEAARKNAAVEQDGVFDMVGNRRRVDDGGRGRLGYRRVPCFTTPSITFLFDDFVNLPRKTYRRRDCRSFPPDTGHPVGRQFLPVRPALETGVWQGGYKEPRV